MAFAGSDAPDVNTLGRSIGWCHSEIQVSSLRRNSSARMRSCPGWRGNELHRAAFPAETPGVAPVVEPEGIWRWK